MESSSYSLNTSLCSDLLPGLFRPVMPKYYKGKNTESRHTTSLHRTRMVLYKGEVLPLILKNVVQKCPKRKSLMQQWNRTLEVSVKSLEGALYSVNAANYGTAMCAAELLGKLWYYLAKLSVSISFAHTAKAKFLT